MTAETKKTVLLVEDEDIYRKAMGMQLGALGYNVVQAEDYEGARAILEQDAGSISAILSDFNYPGANYDGGIGGADLVQLVAGQYPQLPIIVMTGHPSDFKVEMERRGLEPTRLYPKPLRREVLEPALEEVLREAETPGPLLGRLTIPKHRPS